MDIPLFAWLLLFLVIFIFGSMLSISESAKDFKKILSKKGLDVLDSMTIGTYIAGFDSQVHSTSSVICVISKDQFSFFFENGKKCVDINLDSITNIIIEDKTLVTQRLTATRMLALGIFSLAAPKKKKYKEFCIVIEWEDNNVEIQNAVFEFQQELEARTCYNKLKKWLPLKNKKCPFCAETIKRAAVVCKHCNRNLNNE